jgi:antitoxin MazE
MKVAKWGNSLAIRIPKDLAEELALKEGDDVVLKKGAAGLSVVKTDARAKALEWMKDRKWKLPPGYKHDRQEANRRR